MQLNKTTKVAMRLIGMTGALLGVFGLYRCTLAKDGSLTVFETVYAHCVLILVSLNYYCLGKFFHAACYPPQRGTLHLQERANMRESSGAGYVDLVDGFPVGSRRRQYDVTEVVKGLPRLTIQNVWILVYGLGLVFFVTGYCMLGIHPVCLACAGVAMGILSVDELVCPRHSLSPIYLSLRMAALLCGLVGLTLVSADLVGPVIIDYVTSLDLYSIFFGLCLPFVAQFIMIAVRDTRHYSLGTVSQVCEFGFPFTAFLGIFHLSVAYGQRFQINEDKSEMVGLSYSSLFNQSLDYYYWYHQNLTAQSVIRTDGPFLLFYGLTPALLVPAMVSYVECALEGSAIDPLLSISTALCIQQFILVPSGSPSSLGIYGVICCGMSAIVRVMCEYRFMLDCRDPLRLQEESPHLTQRIVWERENRRAREMEELAHEMDEELARELGDPSDVHHESSNGSEAKDSLHQPGTR